MSLDREALKHKSVDELLSRFIALCKGALTLFDVLREKGALNVVRPAFLKLLSEDRTGTT